MAALTVTAANKAKARNNRVHNGRLTRVTVRTGATGVASATEWVQKSDIGLREITNIISVVPIGITGANVNAVANAQGTGVAEGTNRGDLGVEASAAVALEVTVEGIPA